MMEAIIVFAILGAIVAVVIGALFSLDACYDYHTLTPLEEQTLKGWFGAIFEPLLMVARIWSAIIKLLAKGWDGSKSQYVPVYLNENTGVLSTRKSGKWIEVERKKP